MTESRRQVAEETVMTRVGQAVMLHRAGDREEARNRLAALWEETARSGDSFQRCAIAHYLADVQDGPADRLDWALRALAAADAVTGGEAGPSRHTAAVRALYPSLHLGVATGHAGLGDDSEALRALERARRAVREMPDDVHGAQVRAGIDALSARLRAAPAD